MTTISKIHRWNFADMLDVGRRLFAKINIGAEKASELYFKDFEAATELDIDDGLA